MTKLLNGSSTPYRTHCLNSYIDSLPTTPAEASESLLKELFKEAPHVNDTNSFGLTRSVAENVIRALFIRKYTTDGKYLTTLGPDISEHLTKAPVTPIEENKPSFKYATTLTKPELDAYALEFDIELNQSNTKSNMLLDFQRQLGEQ